MEVTEAGPSEDCDLFFRRVGADIPLFSPGSNIAEYTPARALAVSNRFGLTFFAHPEGFSIIRTSELVKLSQELKEHPKNAGTVHEKSLLKVTLPNVRILALSCDDLGLAVCAGSEVRLYDTASLVNEVKVVPAEVQSVGNKNFTKDFKWCPSDDGTYLALTSEGTCSIGRLGGQLEVISTNVLAVSWSADGKYIAYVQGFTLRLRERCSSLSFDIKLPDSFPHLDDCNLQVDSIQWLDAKRMLVCFAQENEDEKEIECPFFVLSSTTGPLADRNSEQKGVIFTELFRAVSPSVLPNASGPYMLASLFASWEIVIAVCRRSSDDHFVFLNWEQYASLEKIKELQLHDDSIPKVAFPVNLDDNAITGMCIDQTTVGLEVVVSRDEEAEPEKLPPCPVFLFTTLEGDLSLFSFARLDKKWHSQHHVKPPSRIEEIERKHIKTSSKAFIDAAISTEAHSKAVASHNTVSQKPNFIGAEMHKGVTTGQNRAPVVPDQKAQVFPLGAKGIMPVGAEIVPRTDKDRQFRLQTLKATDRDADFLSELDEVRRVADEIDELMSTLDVRNGAPQGMLNKQNLESLEKKLSATLTDCKSFKSKLVNIHHEIADLHDQSLQVDAWRIYVQSLVEQAADAKYQDISFHRKLQPEMELKRKNVLRAEQILKERIAELENHFHVLELNQKRQLNDPLRKRASQSSLFGQPQSFQSLYSTVNTQLEVAGQLCSSLTQQMDALKISPSSSRNAYSRRETILKSLGIPADVVHESTSSSEIGSLETLNASGHVLSTPKKAALLEKPGVSLHDSTTRRRRDSMDNAWARVGAAKTTIKRVSHTSPAEKKNNGSRTEQKRFQLWGSDYSPEAGIKTHLSPMSMAVLEVPVSSRQGRMTGKPFMSSNTRQKLESNEGEMKTPDSLRFISTSEASVPTKSVSNIPKKSDANITDRLVKEVMPKTSPFQAVQQPSKMEFLKQEGNKPVNIIPKPELGPVPKTQPMTIAPSVVSKSELKTVPVATLPSTAYRGIEDGAVKMLSNNATSSPMLFPLAPITSSSHVNTLPLATASMVSSSSSTMLSNSGSKVVSSSVAAQAKLEHITQRPASDSPSKEVVPSAASIAAVSSSSMTVTIGANTMSSFENVAPSIASATAASNSSPIPVMASSMMPSPAFNIQPKLDQFSQSSMAQTSGIFSSLSNSQVASGLNSGVGSPQMVAGHTVKPAVIPPVLPTPIESDEEDMDEEISSGGETFGTFGGLGLGGSVASSSQKTNPFGATFTSQPSSAFTLTQPTGQLFRPPSFSLTSAQSSASSQSSTSFFGAASTAPNTGNLFGSPSTSSNTGGNLFGQPSLGAFGKPAQLGPGQQALGSALGAFGQTRQVGFGTPFGSAVGGGITSGGGFANAATGGGFANATGFSSIASGGGFSAFSQKASNSAFASFAGSPGGFGGATPAFGFSGPSAGASGFGAQSSQDERFTQIRK